MSAVTPEMIAVALGVTAPTSGSTKDAQWAMWIADAEMLIEARRLEVDDSLVIDVDKLDYVVREAVVAQVKNPDDATQVSFSVDDASSQRTYRSSRGRVSIIDEWWEMLGLAAKSSGAFSVDTAPRSRYEHADSCAINLGANYCDCGAIYAGYPIFGTEAL